MALGSIFGSIGSAVLGKGLDFLGNKLSADQSQGFDKVAFDYNRYAYNRRYQDTMNDMKLAGLNPILAASGGFSVSNAPTMSSHPMEAPGHSDISSAYNMFAQGNKAEEETKVAKETVKKVANEALLALENIKKTKHELQNIAQQTQNLIAQHAKILEEIKYVGSNAEMKKELVKRLKQITDSWDKILDAWNSFTSGPAPEAVYKFLDKAEQVPKQFLKGVSKTTYSGYSGRHGRNRR